MITVVRVWYYEGDERMKMEVEARGSTNTVKARLNNL
jgi:hypothetical protein